MTPHDSALGGSGNRTIVYNGNKSKGATWCKPLHFERPADISIYWGYIYLHEDSSTRDLTLEHRALDFARASELFAGLTATIVDGRFDYGETRFITAGHVDG
jgi:hypothetical protein